MLMCWNDLMHTKVTPRMERRTCSFQILLNVQIKWLRTSQLQTRKSEVGARARDAADGLAEAEATICTSTWV